VICWILVGWIANLVQISTTPRVRPHQVRPIIRRRDRYGVRERIGHDGTVARTLDEEQVCDIAEEIRERGFESVAICFLNSYVASDHEERTAEIIRELCPDVYVQTSRLYPVTKEAERTNTVAFDAYVGPTVADYLLRLADRIHGLGLTPRVLIMSGYIDDALLRGGGFPPGAAFIEKPFTAEVIGRKVRDVLDGVHTHATPIPY